MTYSYRGTAVHDASLTDIKKALDDGAVVSDTGFNILGYVAKILSKSDALFDICSYFVTTYPLLLSVDCVRHLLEVRNEKLTNMIFTHLRIENPALVGRLYREIIIGLQTAFPEKIIAQQLDNHNDPYLLGETLMTRDAVLQEWFHYILHFGSICHF